jgi:hypothetical protein
MESYVENLNGFFQALRRLSENRCDYWSHCLKIDSSLENAIQNYFSSMDDVELLEMNKITYEEVEALHQKYIFSNLVNVNGNVLDLIKWDLVEYFGLASTAIDPDGPFNPLVSSGALLLKARSTFHGEYVYYLVRYGNKAIITGLAVRA